MDRSLAGHSILIVEDEPLIALDIATAFEKAGAEVTTTTTLGHATILVENEGLSAAVLDHALGDGDSSRLYARLTERNIPFVIYSGYPSLEAAACRAAPHIVKPDLPTVVVAKVTALLCGPAISN